MLKLKQGYSKNLGKAPHKPILLLAVLDMFASGELQENKIYISAELVSRFKAYWQALVTTAHTPNFSLPFYHLHNEKGSFWHLKSPVGLEQALTSSNSIRSFKALVEFVDYAYLSDNMYAQMQEPDSNMALKQFLLQAYFGVEKVKLGTDALNLVENEILHESAEAYQAKVKALVHAPKVVQEEEQFVRSSAFKKAIPRIYQSTCAITGLGIDGAINASMVDACHIVPFAASHNDTIGNGIALCPNMHRAFDRGLIAISDNYEVMVSNQFIERQSIYGLHQFEGKQIWLPDNEAYYPHMENLAWHRKRFGF